MINTFLFISCTSPPSSHPPVPTPICPFPRWESHSPHQIWMLDDWAAHQNRFANHLRGGSLGNHIDHDGDVGIYHRFTLFPNCSRKEATEFFHGFLDVLLVVFQHSLYYGDTKFTHHANLVISTDDSP